MKKRKEKKKLIKKKYLIIPVFALVILSAIFYNKPEPETIVILKELDGCPDLTQSEEGSVMIRFRAVDEVVNIGEYTPTKILLFRSRKIDNLIIYYLYKEKKVTAGIPKLTTPEINLLDGVMHKILYTFKKGYKQAIYIDGKKLSEGKYLPEIQITGFAVKQIEHEISTDKGTIEFDIYGRALTEEEISTLFE